MTEGVWDVVTTTYSFEDDKPILYVWARNSTEKRLFQLRNVRPHFYVLPEEVNVALKHSFASVGRTTKDLFGNTVVEIFTEKPQQVGELNRSGDFSKTWEADVRFPLAMMVERGIYGAFSISNNVMTPSEPLYVPQRVGTCDFEVLAPPEIFPDPEVAEYPMISAAWHDSYTDEYHVFVWVASVKVPYVEKKIINKLDLKTKSEFDHEVTFHVSGNEQSMLVDMTTWVASCHFDIVTGWNSNGFDWLTWFNRAEALGKTYPSLRSQLSLKRLSDVYIAYKRGGHIKTFMTRVRSEVQIAGLVLFDGLTSYKKVMVARGELESYSLAYVAEFELGEERVKEQQADVYATANPFVIGCYPLRDVWFTRRIMEKRRVIDYFDKIRKKTGCRLEDAITNSVLFDSYCLHRAHDMGFVLPSKKFNAAIEFGNREAAYEGAVVRQPVAGRHRNIGVVDFSSHYPNSMIGFNMSPETLVTWTSPNGVLAARKIDNTYVPVDATRPMIEVGNGCAFYIDVKGFIPELLEELALERAKYTQQMDVIAADRGTTNDEWDILYWLSFAVKFINTAAYGVFAYAGFRLFLPEMPDSTTFVGRHMMRSGMTYVETKLLTTRMGATFKHDVIYGDTDSFFLTLPSEDSADLEWVADNVNVYLESIAHEFKMTKMPKIKAERVFRVLVLKDAKKRYFGEMAWKDGAAIPRTDPKRFQIKGFEAKRSDSSRFTQRLQKDILEMIVEFRDERDIYKKIKSYIDEIKHLGVMTPLEKWTDYAIPEGISPDTLLLLNSPRTRGARYAFIHYDKLIMQYMKPKLVYVTFPGAMLDGAYYTPTDVISFEDPARVPMMFWEYIDRTTMIEKCIITQLTDILEAVKMDIRRCGYGQTAMTMYVKRIETKVK